MTIELRWLRPPHTTTAPDRLQFRELLPYIVGANFDSSWTEWKDVPVVVPALPEGHQEA